MNMRAAEAVAQSDKQRWLQWRVHDAQAVPAVHAMSVVY